jgi:hypothetical protein
MSKYQEEKVKNRDITVANPKNESDINIFLKVFKFGT